MSKDTYSLKDETVAINLYNIPNPHSDGMLIGHVVGPNVLFVTDLISPRGTIGRSHRDRRRRRCPAQGRHHGCHHRRRPRRDRQAGGDRSRARGELTKGIP